MDAGGASPSANFWGDTPASEEEYYAFHGIRGTRFYHTTPRGLTLFTRSWEPKEESSSSSPPRALILMLHGYGNDTSWTFQSTPIFLARHGFACFAPDLPSHGRSHGLPAFVPDAQSLLDDIVSLFDSVVLSHPGVPCFLYGESMGGALCLLIHLSRQSYSWAGAILVAPMCRISDRLRPPWPLPQILTLIARFAPTLPIVPTADLVEKSVRMEEKRAVASRNPMRYKGKPRLGTVAELLRVTDDLSSRLSDVTLPFLVLHGSADVVTDPEVSQELYSSARSEDKTIKIYDGMMHSLLFGETDENVDLVRADILSWLNDRCSASQ